MVLRDSQTDAPVSLAVVMISLNEAHNLDAVLDNLEGFAEQVFLVDSYSADDTVDIALRRGVHVVQRRFRGFGDQWNFALSELPITARWTMKLDPDERLDDQLKASVREAIAHGDAGALTVERRLWFMGRPLGIRQDILRLWRTGSCRFSDVLVNEHPIVEGATVKLAGTLEHYDSPNLHHWLDKQNAYSTAEALSALRGDPLSAPPRLFGTDLERRMWLKRHFFRLPFRYTLMWLYCLLAQGAWRAGAVGWVWSRLRADVYRMRMLKLQEMRRLGHGYSPPSARIGKPDLRVAQF